MRGQGSICCWDFFNKATWLDGAELISILVQKGARTNLKNEDGETPLLVAVRVKNIPAIIKLLNHNVPINTRDIHMNSPLHYAATWLDGAELVSILVQRGARTNLKNEDKITPLDVAIGQGHINTARRLAECVIYDPATSHSHKHQAIFFMSATT